MSNDFVVTYDGKTEYEVPWCIPTRNTVIVRWTDAHAVANETYYEHDFFDISSALAFVRKYADRLTNWGIISRQHKACLAIKNTGKIKANPAWMKKAVK